MHRLLRVLPLLFVLGWTSACVEIPEVEDPPTEPPPDAGGGADAGSTPDPDAGEEPDVGEADAGSPPPDAGPADTVRPTIQGTSPLAGATEVPTDAALVLTFSEPMDTDSVEVVLVPSIPLSAPEWSLQGTMVTLRPTEALSENATYTITVDGEDAAGNPLLGTRAFSFTTEGPAPDTTAPTVLATTPSNSSIGNARDTLIELVFSEPMNKLSVQTAFAITMPAGFNSGSFSWNEAGTIMTYRVPTTFSYGTDVTWRVSTSARDLAGNALTTTVSRSFRIIRQGSLTVSFDWQTSGEVGAPGYFRQSHFYNGAKLGDDYANKTYRLFLGFSLDALPENLTLITQATLKWWVTSQVGNPFGKFGQLLLEPVDVGHQLETAAADSSPSPDLIADYHTEPLAPGVSVPPSAVGTPGTFNVTPWVIKDWSDRATRNKRTQYRLRFAQVSDNNNMDDALKTNPDTHPTLAELQIVYEYP